MSWIDFLVHNAFISMWWSIICYWCVVDKITGAWDWMQGGFAKGKAFDCRGIILRLLLAGTFILLSS